MKSILLLMYCLAIGIPLGLALWAKPNRNRGGNQGNANVNSESTSEADIVQAIEALAIALRSCGDGTTADNLLNAIYGALTGTELRMGLHVVIQSINRRKLQGDVGLLIKAERLLS